MTISVQMIFVLIGASVTGQLSDSFGRKKTIIGVMASHAVFNLITAFSNTWQMFAAMRGLLGLSTGGILSVVIPYPAEFIGVKWRAVTGALPTWGFGNILFTFVIWLLKDWVHIHLATAACTVAILPAWIFLPESARWLLTKGRVAKAQRVLHRMARWNRRKSPNISSMPQTYTNSTERQKNAHYFQIFTSWSLAKLSLANAVMWFSCSITYYGIAFGIKNLSGDFYLNFMLMAAVEIPACLLVYPFAGWLGRRWACSVNHMGVSVCCLAVVALKLLLPENTSGGYVNGLCIAARLGLGLGWNVMVVHVTELYPTVVSNIGFGYCNTTARIGGILAPYILSMGEPYMFYAITGTCMAVSAVLPLFLRETKGQPLRDNLPVSSKKRISLQSPEDETELEKVAVDAP